jgi:hypothetical protein
MKIIRRTTLFSLYPIVEFSFTQHGTTYILLRREVSKKSDRYTLVIKKKGSRQELKRHFSFDALRSTFVYLKDDPDKSNQPRRTVCFTCSTL